ncbi:MAG: filamentous hemagglutinin N-terminal domain-containing protein, partial [Symploca sp. SIO2C1]|nr:filamentous hemagglutinin N-terminal domain-containing protein [Symploca sp. SIO2C1]
MARERGGFFRAAQALLAKVSGLGKQQQGQPLKRMLLPLIGSLSVWCLAGVGAVEAQIIQDETLGPESSRVEADVIKGLPSDRIEGGAIRGANLLHSFGEFNIGEGRGAYFANPVGVDNILSRVTGSNPSHLLGTLGVLGEANLFFLNPNGIFFGPNATLDINGSFLGSTAESLTLSDGTFLSTTNPEVAPLLTVNVPSFGMRLEMSQPGAIVNTGNLAVGQGQNLTLVGGTVVSTGQLSAPEGNVTLAAVPGGNLVEISQEGQLLNVGVSPVGVTEDGNGSNAPLELSQLLPEGYLGQATGLTVDLDGTVRLVGSGTAIPTEPGTAIASGTLDASTTAPGKAGGNVQVLGDRVGLLSANVKAFGKNGGGTVRIGGDYQGQGTVTNAEVTFVDEDSTIKADALTDGDGGRVIVWGDDTTRFFGEITARGGTNSGNGGFVEVSGKQHLNFSGKVDLLAPTGIIGTLLLDPNNITIQNTADGTNTNIGGTGSIIDPFTTTDDGAVLHVGNLETALGTASVVVQTGTAGANVQDGDIFIRSPITAPGNDSNLTLQAHRNIVLDANINFNNSTGDVILSASGLDTNNIGAITGMGTIRMGGGALSLSAGSGIGANMNPIQTEGVTALAATTDSGGIFLNNTVSGDINITTVNGISGLTVTGMPGSGDIGVTNTAGNITVGTVTALGNEVTLNTTNGSILDDGDPGTDISANTANLTITGMEMADINIDTDVNILNAKTSNGSVVVDELDGLTLNNVTAMGDGKDVTVTSASGNITVGTVTALDDNVTLNTTNGSIVDDADNGIDISAGTANVTITGMGDFGTAVNGIDTAVDELTVDTSDGDGDQFIDEATDLQELELKAGDGDVTLNAGGAITGPDNGIDITAGTADVTITGMEMADI